MSLEAFRFGHDPMPPEEWWGDRKPDLSNYDPGIWSTIVIPTLEGDHTAQTGDWIIKGVAGECYACRSDIFLQTYEEAEA